MATKLKGVPTGSAAEIYENVFVPGLFQQWAHALAGIVAPHSGEDVLDVACGTGAFARMVAQRVAPDGSVQGLDPDDGMLGVARQKAPDLVWKEGRAEALPYPEASFDVVVSQFGLMFFEDKETALGEMWRVLRPGGRLAVSVWDQIETSVGYAALATLVERLFGDEAANAVRTPFQYGHPVELHGLAEAAGVADAEVRAVAGNVRFDSLTSWLTAEVKGWAHAGLIDDDGFQRLLEEAPQALKRLVSHEGTVRFAMPAQVIVAKK